MMGNNEISKIIIIGHGIREPNTSGGGGFPAGTILIGRVAKRENMMEVPDEFSGFEVVLTGNFIAQNIGGNLEKKEFKLFQDRKVRVRTDGYFEMPLPAKVLPTFRKIVGTRTYRIDYELYAINPVQNRRSRNYLINIDTPFDEMIAKVPNVEDRHEISLSSPPTHPTLKINAVANFKPFERLASLNTGLQFQLDLYIPGFVGTWPPDLRKLVISYELKSTAKDHVNNNTSGGKIGKMVDFQLDLKTVTQPFNGLFKLEIPVADNDEHPPGPFVMPNAELAFDPSGLNDKKPTANVFFTLDYTLVINFAWEKEPKKKLFSLGSMNGKTKTEPAGSMRIPVHYFTRRDPNAPIDSRFTVGGTKYHEFDKVDHYGLRYDNPLIANF
ncbi:hypothetical protein HK098_007032 [Nowakowskiella sp. JEL0407]|nr:hypothetical protein HK098_007032 [Nowakowskiella sp. JEL0407]